MKTKTQKRTAKKAKTTCLASLFMTFTLAFSLTACGGSSEKMIKELADNAGMEVEEVEDIEKVEEAVEEEPSIEEAAEENAGDENSGEEAEAEESNSEKEAAENFEEEKAVETVKGVHIEIVGDTLYVSGTGRVEMRDMDKFWKEYYQSVGYDTTQSEPIVNVVVEEGITAIMDNVSFGAFDAITSISLPDGLTYIGQRVFDGCTNLPSITFPDGLDAIGEAAFKHCHSLASVTFPDGLSRIGIEAFADCGLTSVSFPDSLKSIDTRAFSGCKFTSITLPDGLEGASYFSFMSCKELEEVTFGTGLKYVHDRKQLGHIFAGCDSLKRINAPESSRNLFEEAGYDLSIFEWY